MTTTTTTTLPKNKTGIFAGDTLQDIRTSRSHSQVFQRCTGSANVTVVSVEQNRLLRRAVPFERTNQPTTNGVRNGFRPSTIRRHKSRLTTAMVNRDSKDLIVSKEPLTPSMGSARLKSEIDQLNSQLQVYGDLNKILHTQANRDTSVTPQSALSYSTSNRLSSASTIRQHQRFSSALTTKTLDTLLTVPSLTETSSKTLAACSSPSNEEENRSVDYNLPTTHAYQVPQQSNVGCETILPSHSSTLPKRRVLTPKPISCPFYVMYFTNLALQQSNDHKRTASPTKTSLNTRLHSCHSSKRRIFSPISMATFSTFDDENDSLVTPTPYYNQKRFSAKMTAFENENTVLLKDILRTTSWNHVQT